MGSQHHLTGAALAGLLLASCAGSSMEDQAAVPPPQVLAESDAQAATADSIVVTGQKASRQNREMASPVAVISPFAPPPPPPAPGMWVPTYKDVGRD